jgi:hypothetical protein
MKNNVTVQIYTGGLNAPTGQMDIPTLMTRLTKIYQKTHIACLMVGWNPFAGIGKILDFAKRQGTDVYLWLPVFSGWDGLKPLIDADGEAIQQDYQAENSERFDFGCPADPENVRYVEQLFEKHYNEGSYDGVFLDKIRFPGFMNGISSVFTCFCPYCRTLHGITDNLQTRDASHENPLGITSYDDLHYTFADETLTRLFAYKNEAVTTSIASLSSYFRNHGLKVGLDLFAPFLSHFAGQDYARLAPYADFIKPMFYRETYAPAGIPFEIDRYASAFGSDPQEIEDRKRYLLNILDTSAIDINFINNETAGIRERIGDTKLYAGIEIIYNKKVAPITMKYIQENILQLKNVDGFALSWDLCAAPEENLDAALACL